MNPTTKKIAYAIGVIIGILIILKLTGVIGKKDNRIEVAVSPTQNHDILEYVSATGKAYPVDEVSVSSDVSGEIVDLYVEEGQYVEKGQVLARIQASTYRSAVDRSSAMLEQNRATVQSSQAQVQLAKVNLNKAQEDYNRYKQLYDDKVISQLEYEQYRQTYLQAKSNLKVAQDNARAGAQGIRSAQSSLNEAEENLNKTIIRAPMSGIVTTLSVEEGERVVGTATMAGTEMMTISDMSQMEVRVTVGENDVVKIKPGDTANIELEAYVNKPLEGRVTRISNSSGSTAAGISTQDQAASYTVYIMIDPQSYQSLRDAGQSSPIRPGMSATTRIYTQLAKDAISVPFASVTTRSDTTANDEKKECVFVLDTADNSVHTRFVTTGLQDDEYIQVLTGLKVGEKVVDAPYSAISKVLEDGMKVKVVRKEDIYEEEEQD